MLAGGKILLVTRTHLGKVHGDKGEKRRYVNERKEREKERESEGRWKKAAKIRSNANHQRLCSRIALHPASLLLSVGFLRAPLTSHPPFLYHPSTSAASIVPSAPPGLCANTHVYIHIYRIYI